MVAKRKVGRPRITVPAELILKLRKQGLSFRKIAELTRCGYGSVRRAWACIQAKNRTGESGSRGGAGV